MLLCNRWLFRSVERVKRRRFKVNIFEQFGIRDVADVTLYGITYDKYDNEVYIPVMYFDTLKVSTIEQSAGQASARGGLGNTEHVIWDFGKEISINLQDALYTPTSQNLLWGGTYGLKNMKIKGYWIPYKFKGTDIWNNPEYVEKIVEGTKPEDIDSIEFICPCDDNVKYIYYKANVIEEPIIKGTELKRKEKEIQYQNEKLSAYFKDNFKDNTDKQLAEIEIQNFKDFNEEIYDIIEDNGKYSLLESKYILPVNYDEKKGQNLNKFNRIISQDISEDGSKQTDILQHRVIEYQWSDCGVRMMTFEDNNIAYMEHLSFCYHSQYNNNNKRFYFVNKDNGNKQFESSVEFCMNITKILTDSNGEEKVYNFAIPVGRFYIVEDMNYETQEEEYAIHQINDNLHNVQYLDSLVKLIAEDTFAINTDINLASYQRFEIDKYKNTPIQCFLNPQTMKPFESNTPFYTTKSGNTHYGNLCVIKKGDVYYKYVRQNVAKQSDKGQQIVVNAKAFPGAFRLVGETYIKDRYGEEKGLQIDIPLCKLSSNTNLTLQADGEPATVDMQLKVMRKRNGTMMKFTYHDIVTPCMELEEYIEPSTPEPIHTIEYSIQLLHNKYVYCVPYDCRYSNHRQQKEGETVVVTDPKSATIKITAITSDTSENDKKDYKNLPVEVIKDEDEIKTHITDLSNLQINFSIPTAEEKSSIISGGGG